jgi:hypothetical protein
LGKTVASVIPYFHCLACERILSEFEVERKYTSSGTYVGLCNRCFAPISTSVVVDERADLDTNAPEPDDEYLSETENDETET